jgi:hypothetical protein
MKSINMNIFKEKDHNHRFARHNRNIVESGVKHHKPSSRFACFWAHCVVIVICMLYRNCTTYHHDGMVFRSNMFKPILNRGTFAVVLCSTFKLVFMRKNTYIKFLAWNAHKLSTVICP